MAGKVRTKVKSNLRTAKASTVHDRFKLGFIVPEIAHVLEITRHAVVSTEQRAFGGDFLLAVSSHGIIKNAAYHIIVMAR